MRTASYPSATERLLINAKIRIVKLIVVRSGTYNPMFYRPYQTHFNADIADNLGRRIHETDMGTGGATTSLMAGIANQIMMPTHQHEGMIPITNGWDTVRGRFNMVVEIITETGQPFYYHIQGYTDHYDLSIHGTPDPEMLFYVNSYVKICRSTIAGPTGLQTHDIVTESAQVINGRLVSTLSNMDVYGLRPTEIFSVLQGETVSHRLHQNYGGSHEMGTGVFDNRHRLSGRVVPSGRSNNLPANILSRVVDNYQVSHTLDQFGHNTEDVLLRAKGYVQEGGLVENVFFRQLASIEGIPETAHFKLKHLLAIDPNALNSAVSSFVVLDSNALREINTAGQSEVWHRPNDIGAWVSTVLINAVPTIMLELMITKVQFRATNYDAGSRNTVMFEMARDLLGRDMSTSLHAFERRFVHEIMHDLTHQNQELYSLFMSVDLMGDTVIDIAYGSLPMTRYVAPSFCDSLMTPVMTTNVNNLFNTASDFRQILDTVVSYKNLNQLHNPTTVIDGSV